MDFIKGNEQVKIDPDGINFVGNGNITIDSEKITGDISLNGKVSITDDFDITGKTDFTGDVSLNGKTDFTGDVSLNGKTVFTNDVSLNGNIEISNNDTFVITNQGKVGIGTSEPKCGLHVAFVPNVNSTNDYNNPNFNSTSWYITSQGGQAGVTGHALSQGTVANAYTNNDADLSIWGKGYIMSSQGFIWGSDNRIKTDISLVIDDTALNRINTLESKEYHYIDPERRRPMKTIGFIAQEVKDVVPNAVSLQTAFIPDEMRIITEPVWSQDASDNWLLEIPDLDMSGAFTGKAKFYVSNDPSGNDEVCKEVEIKEVIEQGVLISNIKHFAIFDENDEELKKYNYSKNLITKVNTMRGDDLFKDNGLKIAIKIDVERHEKELINGMKSLLINNNTIIQIEIFESRRKQIEALLNSINFRMFHSIGKDFYFKNYGN